MELSKRRHKKANVYEIRNAGDRYSQIEMKQCISDIVAQTTDDERGLVVDLSKAAPCPLSAVSELLSVIEHAEEQGIHLAFCGMPETLHSFLSGMRSMGSLNMVPTVEEAVAAVL